VPRTVLFLLLVLLAGACRRVEPRLPREPDEPAVPHGGAAGASDADPFFRSFLGRAPPEIPRRGTWVNASERLSLERLRGKVVVLQFAFLGCQACGWLTPWLVAWHERYAPRGLAVVYLDNGRADALDALQAAHVDQGLPFPLFHDRLGRPIADYGVRAFPCVYVLGRDGRVVWEGVATGREAEIESAVVRALAVPATAR
jgi:hypothetical protein